MGRRFQVHLHLPLFPAPGEGERPGANLQIDHKCMFCQSLETGIWYQLREENKPFRPKGPVISESHGLEAHPD